MTNEHPFGDRANVMLERESVRVMVLTTEDEVPIAPRLQPIAGPSPTIFRAHYS